MKLLTLPCQSDAVPEVITDFFDEASTAKGVFCFAIMADGTPKVRMSDLTTSQRAFIAQATRLLMDELFLEDLGE